MAGCPREIPSPDIRFVKCGEKVTKYTFYFEETRYAYKLYITIPLCTYNYGLFTLYV